MNGVVTFRPMREADVPLLHEWIHRPHVVAWWGRGDTHDSVEDTKQKYLPRLEDRSAAKGYIALVSGEPIGFIQSYVALGSRRPRNRSVPVRGRQSRAGSRESNGGGVRSQALRGSRRHQSAG